MSYITEVEKVRYDLIYPEIVQRDKVVIRNGLGFIAAFPDMESCKATLDYMGVSCAFREKKKTANNGIMTTYDLSHKIVDAERYFWNLGEIPENVKPINGYSNGSFVTCYFVNNGNKVTIYRPNPNAKNVYKPWDFWEGINHVRAFGDLTPAKEAKS